jgi:putative phosphoesterase
MQKVALVSDTHIPTRANEIPEPFVERIREADQVIHAGDFVSEAAFDTVAGLADGALTAVEGNMDRDLDLPAVATVAIEGAAFVVTHGTGDPVGYEGRVIRTVREHAGADAIGVAGHSHDVLDTVRDGIRILNPGSVTGASPAEATTMMTATVEDGEVDVSLHEQPGRPER